MYTIKEAATRTGISIPTIRVWERRYGVVSPTRTAAGYRLYDEGSRSRIPGHAPADRARGLATEPGRPAEFLAEGSDIAQLVSLSGPTGPGDQSEGGGLAPGRAGEVVDALLRASRRLDVRGIERLLDESFAAQRFESAMDQVVFPALRAIGSDWELGHIDAAREHAASETIRRRIAHYFDAAGGRDGDATVVVGLPPGSHHELGAFAFAVAARRAGLNVLYLGGQRANRTTAGSRRCSSRPQPSWSSQSSHDGTSHLRPRPSPRFALLERPLPSPSAVPPRATCLLTDTNHPPERVRSTRPSTSCWDSWRAAARWGAESDDRCPRHLTRQGRRDTSRSICLGGLRATRPLTVRRLVP